MLTEEEILDEFYKLETREYLAKNYRKELSEMLEGWIERTDLDDVVKGFILKD